jgi:hypothetical protein
MRMHIQPLLRGEQATDTKPSIEELYADLARRTANSVAQFSGGSISWMHT